MYILLQGDAGLDTWC